MDHVHPRARAELETFFAPGGPSASFRVRVEEGCIGGAFPTYDWKKLYVHVDAKWGLESLLAARLFQSKWFTSDQDAVSLVAFRPHTGERSLLTRCRLKLERDFPGKQFWFTAATDRGRCCDGGQLRDPGLLNHHFLVASGERRRGAWLFREHNAKHAWRAPATRDTAPRLRCFDPATDVALPPPAFLRGLGPVWKSSSELGFHAIEQTQQWDCRLVDGVEPPRHRAGRHDNGESIASMAWGA